MKNKIFLCRILFFNIFLLLSVPVFADNKSSASTTPKPYDTEEFPQALKDLRRFEIITLGSIPFVMLDATLVYSGYQYLSGNSSEFNFLGGTTYDLQETKKIILTSLGISVGIGLTDYIVQVVKRSKTKKNIYQKNNSENLIITTKEPSDSDFEFFDDMEFFKPDFTTPVENTQTPQDNINPENTLELEEN